MYVDGEGFSHIIFSYLLFFSATPHQVYISLACGGLRIFGAPSADWSEPPESGHRIMG